MKIVYAEELHPRFKELYCTEIEEWVGSRGYSPVIVFTLHRPLTLEQAEKNPWDVSDHVRVRRSQCVSLYNQDRFWLIEPEGLGDEALINAWAEAHDEH